MSIRESERIPVMKALLPDPLQVLPRLQATHNVGIYSNYGPQVRELEGRFARYFGVSAEQVVVVANATLGIQGALACSPTLNWVLPSYTFAATIHAALNAHKSVSLTDIDASHWWMDLTETELGNVGILPVAPFGAAISLEHWPKATEIVFDAAASVGSAQSQLGALQPGWAVVFSLHATKPLGAGEGGVVVFGSEERANRMRSWINFGFAGTRKATMLSTNAKMSELTAAYVHTALDHWADEQSEWLEARRITNSVTHLVGLPPTPIQSIGISPYWIAQFPDSQTVRIVEHELQARGIETRRWWPVGCHTMPAFSELPRSPMPNTERLAGQILGLPMYRGLTQSDADRIHGSLEVARDLAGTW